MKSVRSLLILFLFTVLGAAAACGLSYLFVSSDILVAWEKIQPAPPGAVEIVAADASNVYVRTGDGAIYGCYIRTSDCWEPDADPSQIEDIDTRAACTFTGSPFRFIAGPPKNIQSCIDLYGGYAEMGFHVLYTLDDGGNVWRWESSSSAYEILVIPVIAIAGALAGLILGAVGLIGYEILRGAAARRRQSAGNPD